MYKEKIGIIGGFGAYATLGFYQRLLEAFASDNERNYPHMIIDNNFTMPSRTRALLYEEGYDEVVLGIADSMRLLLGQGVDRIVLVCGTSHYFLEDVYKLVPEAEEKVMDMIDILGETLEQQGQRRAVVIAAEGTLQKQLYPKRLEKYQIVCKNPSEDCYGRIRYFIECVKRNQITREAGLDFLSFLGEFQEKNVILGCTEFPVLVKYLDHVRGELCKEQIEQREQYTFWDPLEVIINRLKDTLT